VKPTVLLVESGSAERAQLTDALLRAGCLVRACSDLASARRALGTEAFPVAVVRAGLPDGSWLDFMRLLRNPAKGDQTAVVVLTTEVEAREKTAILEAGVQRLIGSPFDAALVARQAASLALVGVADESGSGGRLHLLLVDDSATYAYALINELEKDGYEMTHAQSGAEALAFLTVGRADILVLDVFLPDMNGIELCRRIRSMPQTRAAKIMMLTGRKTSVVKEKAVEAGADDFAVKARELGSIRERVASLRDGVPSSRQKPAAAPEPQPKTLAVDAKALSDTIDVERVVEASGLSKLVGRQAIRGAFARVGVDGLAVSPQDLEKALPHIERILRLFLGEDNARERLQRIAAMKAGVLSPG
jgi:DNA-binding response OmpR family regulator